MITMDDVKQIRQKISLENGISNILSATTTKYMKIIPYFNLFVHCATYH